MSGKNSAVNRKAVSSSDEDSGSDSSDSDIFTTTVNLAPLRKAVKETRPKLAEAPLVEEKEKPKTRREGNPSVFPYRVEPSTGAGDLSARSVRELLH
ncbi:hypothetical protein ADEAN_000269600 [Angomonas deanei]|uniref:Uncharacterized protein n=1 Tax=Angomonas deanei TaxID=59799 RepID=A0A7G2C878_9TRYP|nr:hypothetical protein ADEAN_000269600 [Angomonas deanei]